MSKIEKGRAGYIKAQKNKYLLYSIIEFSVVTAIFFIGYTQTGSRMNLMTVVAVLGCLPAAKMLVEFITMAPHKSIDPVKFAEIEEKAPLIIKAYDLIITNTEKVMPVSAVVIYGNTICGYCESPKTDEVKCVGYLKEMFHANKFDKVTVKIFHDYTAFLTRAEGMNSIASIEQDDNRKKAKKIRKLLLTTAM